MNRTTRNAMAGALLAGTLFSGCASAPTEAVTAAQEALGAAEEMQANVYVADLYQAAQDSFAAAQAEIELQNGQFALSRDYSRAEALLRFVSETAVTAADQVEERKEAMRAEAETLIAQAQQALATAQELLAQAPRGKEGNVALVAISEDTGSAQMTLNDAVAAFRNDDVAAAHHLGQTALDKASALVTELSTAISKTHAPRS